MSRQDKLPNCLDCGKRVSAMVAKRCRGCNNRLPMGEEQRRRISEANKGKKKSPEERRMISLRMKGNKHGLGHKHTEESKKKMSDATRGIPRPNWRGENAYWWRGGITSENAAFRNSLDYKKWRTSVFERDNYTCQFCGQWGGELHVDHIKPFSKHPELRLSIDNGRTLCRGCHQKTETYAGKIINYEK